MATTLVEHTGQTYGHLTIGERAGHDTAGHATWHAVCTCWNHVIVRGDYLRTGRTWHCGCKGRKRADTLTYSGAHSRLRRTLGKASEHTCPCGKPAQEWAFQGCDDAIVTNGLAPYCQHACPDEYVAMCRTCADLTDLMVRETLR